MRKLLFQFLYFYILQMSTSVPSEITATPNFSAPITNITVPVGREGVLTCIVHDLINYKVAWLRIDTQTILTIQNHVITKNHRIGIINSENRIWQLRIRDVRESDRGWYMCQINTDPMKSQTGYLDVVVPPDILDLQTSHDMTVQEGQNVTLKCAANGSPDPLIEWRREKGKPLLAIGGNQEIFSVKGSTLEFKHANRNHMGAYLCIASNGVPPTVSKRVVLIVNFPPAIWIRQEIIYASIGQKIILECITEAHPNSVNYWLHGKEFVQGGTYESITFENIYKVIMKLIIRPIDPKDFGTYKCIAKNSMGEKEKTIFIHHKTKSIDSPAQNYQPASQLGNTIRNDWTMDYFSKASSTSSFTSTIIVLIFGTVIYIISIIKNNIS